MKRTPLQVNISQKHHGFINKKCKGRRVKGVYVEGLIDIGEQMGFDPFKITQPPPVRKRAANKNQ